MSTIVVPPLPKTVTPEELLALPDASRYELIDGQLVEKKMGSESCWVGGKVYRRLDEYADRHGGWAFQDGTHYRCFGPKYPNRVRVPDASYVAAGRLPNDEIPLGFMTVVPDVVVEVISPSDSYYLVEAKVEEFLDAGVKLVWLVNPNNRTIRVFENGKGSIQLRADEELTGGEVLPGFSCRIADLFPAHPAPRPPVPSDV